MKRGENGDKIIREVIRGERPWTDLRSAGIEVQLQGDRFHIENPHQARAAADIHDLAQGLIAHLKDGRELRSWAFLLQAESFVDWADGENHPAWEALWDAVWSA